MPQAVITHALRTPIGRYGGALAGVRPDDLAALAIRALVERSAIEPASIDDVILGCANQAGEDNRNVARMAVLLAGLPVEVSDTSLGWRFANPKFGPETTLTMGETAEEAAALDGIGREDSGAFRSEDRRSGK